MLKVLSRLTLKVLFTTLILLPSLNSYAESTYTATTHINLEVEAEDLSYLLLPLTKSELEVEAQAWQKELSTIVREMSLLEIEIKHLNRQTNLFKQAANEVTDYVEASKSGDKDDIADTTSALTETANELNIDQDKINNLATIITDKTASKVDKKALSLENKKIVQAKKVALIRLELARVNNLFTATLAQLHEKGGDITELQAYSNAVSGLNVNVSDSSTAWLAIAEWIKSENGGVLLFINLVKFIIAITFVIFLSNLAGRIADRLTRSNAVSLLLEDFIKVAARRTVLIIGIIMTLPIIGINIGPVLALIGAAGLVVGLALQGTLSNFASGVLILIYRPYDMNDVIQVGGVTGIVSSMTLLCTTIKTLDNQLITVPNNNVWNDTITNVTGSSERRVDLVFGIAYGDDFTKAQKIMHDILSVHPKVLKHPESIVRVHELGDSSVNFVCRPWVKTDDYWDVHWDVIEAVKREFDAQGISIPFPQRDVHLFTEK